MKITFESISNDLQNLGVMPGDTLFITADLMKVGYFHENRDRTYEKWIEILTNIVGDNGTIIAACYTKSYLKFTANKSSPFHLNMPPTSGSLSAALLQDRRSFRSAHPTNSYIGIGKHAEEILKDHDENGMSYDPIGKIIELNGKNLMLGTIDKKNAPMVFHYCQQLSGYTLKDPFSHLGEAYFLDKNKNIKKFKRKDVGGCSSGAHKLYGMLVDKGACRTGKVGKSNSALLDAKKSFQVVSKELKITNSIAFCDDVNCLSCYGRFSNVGLAFIRPYLYSFVKLIRLLLSKFKT